MGGRASTWGLYALAVVCACLVFGEAAQFPSENKRESPALLVALQDGPEGEANLLEWSTYVGSFNERVAPVVWILCPTPELEATVLDTPNVWPFAVKKDAPWGRVLDRFRLWNAHVYTVALLGEGTLPNDDLFAAMKPLDAAVTAIPSPPTAIVARSRSAGEWLSDKLVAQVWCNRMLLDTTRTKRLGLYDQTVGDLTLLEVLPRLLVRDPVDIIIVDGTTVLPSTFVGTAPASMVPRPGEGDFRIHSSEFGLGVEDGAIQGSGGANRVVKALWPPRYMLEHVATKDGVVVVNSASCGDLDLAANFLHSVRRTSDLKVRMYRALLTIILAVRTDYYCCVICSVVSCFVVCCTYRSRAYSVVYLAF